MWKCFLKEALVWVMLTSYTSIWLFACSDFYWIWLQQETSLQIDQGQRFQTGIRRGFKPCSVKGSVRYYYSSVLDAHGIPLAQSLCTLLLSVILMAILWMEHSTKHWRYSAPTQTDVESWEKVDTTVLRLGACMWKDQTGDFVLGTKIQFEAYQNPWPTWASTLTPRCHCICNTGKVLMQSTNHAHICMHLDCCVRKFTFTLKYLT